MQDEEERFNKDIKITTFSRHERYEDSIQPMPPRPT